MCSSDLFPSHDNEFMKKLGYRITLSQNEKVGISGMRIVKFEDINHQTEREYKPGYKLSEITNTLKNQDFPIVLNNFEPLVSSDFKKENYTTIIDHRYTNVLNNMIKLLVWYDNEWGYASKVVEILNYYTEIKKGK